MARHERRRWTGRGGCYCTANSSCECCGAVGHVFRTCQQTMPDATSLVAANVASSILACWLRRVVTLTSASAQKMFRVPIFDESVSQTCDTKQWHSRSSTKGCTGQMLLAFRKISGKKVTPAESATIFCLRFTRSFLVAHANLAP